MGRLPATFGGRVITARSPWTMSGELALTSAQQGQQYPDSTYINNADRPFEIHRLIPFVTALDVNGVPLVTPPDQDQISALVRVQIQDLGKVNPLVKSPTLVRALVKGSSERTWEFADPYYLVKGEQFQVTLNALTFPAIANLVSLSVALNFEGFFVTQGPPSESR